MTNNPIRESVEQDHLKRYPNERDLLNPFLDGFEITWAKRVPSHNTHISVYFLLPKFHYKESYGFENEIMLIYSPFSNMEPRTLQAIEQVFTQSPAKGRVETLNYFLISDYIDIEKWLDSYNSSKQETKIIVAFSKDEILHAKGDQWFLRNKLNKKFFGRDLFDYSLPLIEDSYFFGRENIYMEYIDAIKKKENKGVFGLRKTGKTSLLFKIKRLYESNQLDTCILYLDCKLPSIRMCTWFELLEYISEEIVLYYSKNGKDIILKKKELDFSQRKASRNFLNLISKLKDEYNQSVCLMFDEIEYISYISPTDQHWKKDYIEFWQTLWAAQSQIKNLNVIIGGVNSSIVEIDLINDVVQNPLFGIVSSHYLTGFDKDECWQMLKKLGKRMGLKFDPDASVAIRDWYGGHPLLIRKACSNLNNILSLTQDKPIDITKAIFESYKEDIDKELIYYSDHAISEIKLFYPDEYYMLELLSANQYLDFNELAHDRGLLDHLLKYQLIKKVDNEYIVNIPVIAARVAHDYKKEHGSELIYPIIHLEKRETWLLQRVSNISKEFNILDKLVAKSTQNKLFGSNSFPEGVEFSKIKIVNSKEEFSIFINVLNRCFVESVEKYGKDLSKPKYFWEDIKSSYPFLWDVLHRIKVYRNDLDHLHLNSITTNKYLLFIQEDFEGRSFSQVKEPYFILQQRILDRLLLALQKEIERYN